MCKKYVIFSFIVLVFTLALTLVTSGSVLAVGTFKEPIVESVNGAGAADPWVIYRNGYYYYCKSLNDASIGVAKAKRLQDIGCAPMVTVYTPPAGTMYSKEIWAPELFYLDGKWYIYFAADDGNNNNHRMYVIEGNSQDPQGSYTFKGKIAATTDKWAIDGTVLVKDDGSKYFVWSGWAGDTNVQQNIYIAAMSNAYTISGDRVLISQPTNSWEKIGTPLINEGPEVLKKNGVIHIIYSASGSWTDDYCLGKLTCTNGNVMNAASWTKTGPVFSKVAGAYGPGHASFTKSPDGKEDWIVYHADRVSGASWGGRSVRAQKFTWNGNDPSFGTPYAYGTNVTEPSLTTSTVRYEAENATIFNCKLVSETYASGGKVVGGIDYADSYCQFTVNVSRAGTYLLVAGNSNGWSANSTHKVYANGTYAGDITYFNKGWEVFTTAGLVINLNAGSNTVKFMKGTNYAELDFIELVSDATSQFEAESATLYNCRSTAETNASCGLVAGFIDYADSYCEFIVNVPTTRTYTLGIRNCNGSGAASTHNVYVNGTLVGSPSYPSNGWNNFTTVTMSVNLNAGSNAIKFVKGTNYAELDYIEIY